MAGGGLGAAAAAGETGPAAAPCTIIMAALLSPRCMQVAVSMEKPPGTCLAGGGANGLELRRSLWLEVGSAWCQWPRGAWALVPSPHHVLLLWCLLPGPQEGQGLQIGLLVALGECHGAEVRVSR